MTIPSKVAEPCSRAFELILEHHFHLSLLLLGAIAVGMYFVSSPS